jgi:hypothetical protein
MPHFPHKKDPAQADLAREPQTSAIQIGHLMGVNNMVSIAQAPNICQVLFCFFFQTGCGRPDLSSA